MISFRNWIQSLRFGPSNSSRHGGRQRQRAKGSGRLDVEMLETRLVPATTPSSLVIDSTTGAFPQIQIAGPNPNGGLFVPEAVLSNGNIVAISFYSAAYLFSGQTGALISTLTGDVVAATALTNGNFVVIGRTGTATWVNGTTGLNGAISGDNSLFEGGSQYAEPTVVPLTNGNYVLRAPDWNGHWGSVTWCSGTGPTTGTVSASNSLVGTSASDVVGSDGVFALPNGNYVVDSPFWNNYQGAATWADGNRGITGTISAANSLIAGGTPGSLPVTLLSNGNYVVDNPRNAVTWCDGNTGLTETMSASNSLVGDSVGSDGVIALSNGNYVVDSYGWNNYQGAVTWANGATGLVGTLSAANSLVGIGSAGYGVGAATIIALTNGNYVVDDPGWNVNQGAVTWGDGANGTVGVISAANSLIGSNPANGINNGDQVGGGLQNASGVTPLANGNYVVDSPFWNGSNETWLSGTGAVTWGNGTSGTSGVISAANSLVGSTSEDMVGYEGVTALTNGNYIVGSANWNQQEGAVTWGNGATGITGTVSAANSLVGSTPNVNLNGTPPDLVGYNGVAAPKGLVALANGNYLVLSMAWDNGAGAVTWGNGITGTVGTVSSSNSFSGINESVIIVPFALPNGNCVVTYAAGSNPFFSVPEATWIDGTTGSTLDGRNTPDKGNSLYGDGGGDSITPIGSGGTFIYSYALNPAFTIAFTDPNLLTYAFGQGHTITVTPDFITRALDAGTNLTLQANDDIVVNSPISETPAATAGSLAFEAGRNILVNSSITTAGGNLNLTANDTLADGVVDTFRDPGNAVITIASGTTLNAGAGNLSIDLKNSTDKTNNQSGAVTVLGITASASTLSSTSTLGISIDGNTPGAGGSGTYTQLNVNGSLNLNGAPLSMSHTTGTAMGNTFTIVTTSAGVSGTFAGLSEGDSLVASDGTQFRISYRGSGGKNVVLTQLTNGPTTISGTVFQDINTDGLQNSGEAGLAGEIVFLDLDGSGMLKAGDPNTTTDANGNYELTVPNVGTYSLREERLGGVLFSAPAAGSYQLTLAGGGNVTGENFGNVPTSIAEPLTLTPNTPFPKHGDPNADYVEALYRTVLDRNADPVGLAGWTSALTSGALSRLQVAQGIRNSQEHFTDEVTDFYMTILDRAPDLQGLQGWVADLQSGFLLEEQLVYYFLDSPEYLSRGDKYFVDHMYLALLGRTFDAGGEAGWLGALGDDTSGNPTHAPTLTHAQVIIDFLYSHESLVRLVEGYYQVFLHRLADPTGLNGWVGALAQGRPFLEIGQQFLTSDEFYNDAAAEG
jgi:hypothetical protein